MIVGKLSTGGYITDFGAKILPKEFYEKEKLVIDSQVAPTEKELIELGKQVHPFYRKEMDSFNLTNLISEINVYEAKKDKIIIDDTKLQ